MARQIGSPGARGYREKNTDNQNSIDRLSVGYLTFQEKKTEVHSLCNKDFEVHKNLTALLKTMYNKIRIKPDRVECEANQN